MYGIIRIVNFCPNIILNTGQQLAAAVIAREREREKEREKRTQREKKEKTKEERERGREIEKPITGKTTYRQIF